jgi:uncharacterized heparinase superfamily protein
VALVFAGGYFAGPDACGWLTRGRQILDHQIDAQILSDGGHEERSPMYHAIVMEDILDACNILQSYALAVPPAWLERASQMCAWLLAMSHPDGDIAFFNDAAFGIAVLPAELIAYAQRMVGGAEASAAASAPGSVLLKDSGYARLSRGDAVLIADCGAIGPDHLPGHAHADTLSFELSLGTERVLVNSGTSLYAAGLERQRQRGTAAHNTVVVDGEDSSEVWHAFRTARRARPLDVVFGSAAEGESLRASHDGYRRLAGRNLHTRSWLLRGDGLLIEDTVSGASRSAVAYFHLHPDVTLGHVDVQSGTAFANTRAGRHLRWAFRGAARVEAGESSWHPGFGSALRSQCLKVEARAGQLATEIEWH